MHGALGCCNQRRQLFLRQPRGELGEEIPRLLDVPMQGPDIAAGKLCIAADAAKCQISALRFRKRIEKCCGHGKQGGYARAASMDSS